MQNIETVVVQKGLWKRSVKQLVRRIGSDFYRAGIQALVQRWCKIVERNGVYVEKYHVVPKECISTT